MPTSRKKRVKGKVAYISKAERNTDGAVAKQGQERLSPSVFIEGHAPEGYQKQADEVINGVMDVLENFGFSDKLRGVLYSDKKGSIFHRGEAYAAMNGQGDLTIIKSYLKKPIESSNGYNINDSFYGTGAHEAGHLISRSLIDNVKINPGDTNKTDSLVRLEKASVWRTGKLEAAILKEAKRRYGSNPPISKYGSTKHSEKVAEAVCDVFANKKPNPYSKVIVDVMKDIKAGKFIPTIKVSKREMERL